MPDSITEVVADYLKGFHTKDPQYKQAAMRITAMTFGTAPELQWPVILEAVRQSADADDLGHVAAGPIEGFLGFHGAAWIDRVEAEARRNPKFARAITGVWKFMIPRDVWERVKDIKFLVPLEDWLPAGLQELKTRVPPPAQAAVIAAIEADFPARSIDHLTLCATETKRLVVHAFLPVPKLRPTPYVIYAVDKESMAVRQLNGEEAKPYTIKNRK